MDELWAEKINPLLSPYQNFINHHRHQEESEELRRPERLRPSFTFPDSVAVSGAGRAPSLSPSPFWHGRPLIRTQDFKAPSCVSFLTRNLCVRTQRNKGSLNEPIINRIILLVIPMTLSPTQETRHSKSLLILILTYPGSGSIFLIGLPQALIMVMGLWNTNPPIRSLLLNPNPPIRSLLLNRNPPIRSFLLNRSFQANFRKLKGMNDWRKVKQVASLGSNGL